VIATSERKPGSKKKQKKKGGVKMETERGRKETKIQGKKRKNNQSRAKQ
jgi:hypothetical protein